MDKAPEDYIGDGVYITYDGYAYVLDLRAQGTDKIALEPAVLRGLLYFVESTNPDLFKALLREHTGRTD